ncbi:enoyl-CoA hydratase/isomerase family protein [Nakamurella sp. YIM 132087]|uniref:Enoyl-CoA hydratase/isomerase family protein n=1 Tax=Nakamurella alba TaxID=2665158 RepID=A0A7K1FQD9_9ACTN|nr:enoyl-CoA hydratase/isomerase family protein [Nakamurella alba]MTD16290.1 enoyl-CoA hydratase/isomerase family protein [Nakamurella alba]
MSAPVLLEIRDGVGVVTMSRPERMNAVSLDLAQGLHDTLGALAVDDAVRAVVLTGAGPRAFGAGLDIREAATLDSDQLARQHELYSGVQRMIADFPKPTIAAVNGVAAGASFQLALHCDLLLAAPAARFGMPELAAGRPCIIGSYLLHRRIGPGLAADLVLTGRWLPATEAVSVGLVSRIVQPEFLLEAAVEAAAAIGGRSPAAVAATLSWLRELRTGAVPDLAGAFDRGARVSAESADPDAERAALAVLTGSRS